MATHNYAVITGDELGTQTEYFEKQYKAENWASLLHGSMIELNAGIDIEEAIKERRITAAVAKYESKEADNIVI